MVTGGDSVRYSIVSVSNSLTSVTHKFVNDIDFFSFFLDPESKISKNISFTKS